ncbi:hypothetical protein B5X24_HaOG210904 [Helicoverpa armigera]|uniref:Sushi domain-containing protein n=1 Tax=Helicoverpa armigera TaxID=29058 RepID=A0A2W1BC95_HELAM|nr:hypothetical protein B5X24_HaOG210904 [Helicoverpa armigera]
MHTTLTLPHPVRIFNQWLSASTCQFPGAPAHCKVTFSEDAMSEGTIASYECERGFELLGPARRLCGANGKWTPDGIPFCGELFFAIDLIE